MFGNLRRPVRAPPRPEVCCRNPLNRYQEQGEVRQPGNDWCLRRLASNLVGGVEGDGSCLRHELQCNIHV